MNSKLCFVCSCPCIMRCSRCKLVFYCGRDCQAAHWKSHKTVCKDVLVDEKENYPSDLSKTVIPGDEKTKKKPSTSVSQPLDEKTNGQKRKTVNISRCKTVLVKAGSGESFERFC